MTTTRRGFIGAASAALALVRLAPEAKTVAPPVDNDQKYLDMLEELERKGIPVPIRVWAEAAGYNLDDLDGMLR